MIGYAEIIVQEHVEGENIYPQEKNELLTVPFPLSPPMDFPKRQNYSGIKIAPLSSGRIVVSWFFYDGTKDEDGRPLLRARAIIAGTEDFPLIRDLKILLDFLRSKQQSLDQLEVLAKKKSFLFSNIAMEQFVRELDENFIGRVLSTIYSAKMADILAPRNEEHVLRVIFGLLPANILRNLSICTSWGGFGEVEDILISNIDTPRKCPKINWDKKKIKGGTKLDAFVTLIEILKVDTPPFPPTKKFNLLNYILREREFPEELEKIAKTISMFDEFRKKVRKLK